jgi:hypothetical protein
MSSQEETSRPAEGRKYSFFFPSSRRTKSVSQPGSPGLGLYDDDDIPFPGQTRKRTSSRSMPVATNAYYQPKTGSILKARTVSFEPPQSSSSSRGGRPSTKLESDVKNVIREMISEQLLGTLISETISDLEDRVKELEDELKRSNDSHSFKFNDLKFRMTILEDKVVRYYYYFFCEYGVCFSSLSVLLYTCLRIFPFILAHILSLSVCLALFSIIKKIVSLSLSP